MMNSDMVIIIVNDNQTCHFAYRYFIIKIGANVLRKIFHFHLYGSDTFLLFYRKMGVHMIPTQNFNFCEILQNTLEGGTSYIHFHHNTLMITNYSGRRQYYCSNDSTQIALIITNKEWKHTKITCLPLLRLGATLQSLTKKDLRPFVDFSENCVSYHINILYYLTPLTLRYLRYERDAHNSFCNNMGNFYTAISVTLLDGVSDLA